MIIVILLQSGRGGGLAGSLGGGISTAMFGGQGADKLMTRLTTGLAAAFMVLAILISITGRPRAITGESVVRQRAVERETAPLQPVTEMELPEAVSPAELPLPPEGDQSTPNP
ncbi:MAG: preprotein translocase subunit SecG [Fidelibacterota bacterium]|nr:MAG: preprotein translocase subunit SecG [Candidatus Neomarinimicrobiota bacterium]